MFNSNRLQRRHIQQRIEKLKTIGYVLLLIGLLLAIGIGGGIQSELGAL